MIETRTSKYQFFDGKNKDTEDIYFFEVNTKYISSNVMKISVISRVFFSLRELTENKLTFFLVISR